MWENHLGASCEQEEKVWDWRKCAAFLTSSVICKTGFMLPSTSAIWRWCSLQISILLILFILQALCSCPLMGDESGQISSRVKAVLTQMIKIVIKIISVVLFAGQEPHYFSILSKTHLHYFLLPELRNPHSCSSVTSHGLFEQVFLCAWNICLSCLNLETEHSTNNNFSWTT